MEWSKEQKEGHEQNAEKFREAYVKGENKTASLEAIVGCRRKCVTLVRTSRDFGDNAFVDYKIKKTFEKIRERLSGTYFQEIPHFTLDCHRYLTEDNLPADINQMPLSEQRDLVITPEEFCAYDRVLAEEIEREKPFLLEVKGIAFGGDGLIAQVWYDDKRMIDFTTRLGERVRREVPSMDFQWGMVKGKVPYRIVNLTRFTGSEDRGAVIEFVDRYRAEEFGEFNMRKCSLLFSDHYLQSKNTKTVGAYNFSE